MRATYRRSGLAAIFAGTAIALAACSSSSSPPGGQGTSSPTVASLPPSTTAATTSGHSGGSATTTLPKSDSATALVDEWATCIRKHGDPNQTDPTIDSHGGINIIVPQGVSSHQFGKDLHNATGTCSQYLAAAQKVLRLEFPARAFVPDEALLVQYADCMRTNGVTNYPDPTGDQTNLIGINMNSPVFENANKVCGKQINAPAWWINGWGPPGDISSSSGPNGGVPHSNPVPTSG